MYYYSTIHNLLTHVAITRGHACFFTMQLEKNVSKLYWPIIYFSLSTSKYCASQGRNYLNKKTHVVHIDLLNTNLGGLPVDTPAVSQD